MKKLQWCSILFLFFSIQAQDAHSQFDPADRFLDAYFLIQDGDKATQIGDIGTANTKYLQALSILEQIKATNPNWNQKIMNFRVAHCTKRLQENQMPEPTISQAPTHDSNILPTNAIKSNTNDTQAPIQHEGNNNDRIRHLTTELQQSRDYIRELEAIRTELAGKLANTSGASINVVSTQEELARAKEQIRQLEASRTDLNNQLMDALARAGKVEEMGTDLQQAQTKIAELEFARTQLNSRLQEALNRIPTTETTNQIEDLLRRNAQMAEQLAASQNEIAQLRGERAAAESAEVIKLRSELTQVRNELTHTQDELQRVRGETTSLRAELRIVTDENRQLRKAKEMFLAQLNEAERQLQTAQASRNKDDQIIRELRKENALLQQIVEHRPITNKETRVATAQQGGGFWKKLWPWKDSDKPNYESTATARSPIQEVGGYDSGKLVATFSTPGQLPTTVPSGFPDLSTNGNNNERTPIGKSLGSTPSPSGYGNYPAPTGRIGTQTLLREASGAFQNRDFESAAAIYEDILNTDPNNAVALSNLGVIRHHQSRIDEAEELLQQAVRQVPNDSAIHSTLGVIYFHKGQVEDAFSELTRAVALNPRNAEAHNYLGITLSEKGWPAAAELEIRKAIELNPNYADAHFNMAVLCTRLRTPKYSQARSYYSKALQLGAAPDLELESVINKDASAQLAVPSSIR